MQLKQLIVPITVLAILASILVPLPPALMDLLLVGNLLFSLVLLISTLYLSDPLKLSSLPTILLLATLYRLALNISTTRLILGHGDAGRVVEAFGQTVIQGNIAVGVIIFAVITLVQFIVVAKGSERVAEVSARFTLDALPGKQMSIDADVRAGLLDMDTARLKRQELQVESRFYGALDGAMKFVKGDAVAAIIIVIINLIGGLTLGMLVEGLEPASAISKYCILSVGDGLLAQIPALMSSLAAGMIVTRVASSDGAPLATEVVTQLGQVKPVKVMIGMLSLALSCAPGIPSFPFIVVGGFLLIGAAADGRSAKLREKTPSKNTFQPKVPPLIEIELSKELAIALSKIPELTEEIDKWRQSQHSKQGLILARPDLGPLEGKGLVFQITMRGIPLLREELPLPAEASTAGLNIAKEALQRILQALDRVARDHSLEFIDDILTRRTLDFFERTAPELVASVVPGIVTVTHLTTILKALVSEQIPIKNFDLILQAIAESSNRASSERVLLEEVRIALGRVIINSLSADGNLPDAALLDAVTDVTCCTAVLAGKSIDPELADGLTALLKSFDTKTTVLVSSRQSRRAIRELLLKRGQNFRVIAHEELVGDARLNLFELPAVNTRILEESFLAAA